MATVALAYDIVTASRDATPDRAMLFLHGILGRRGNWRSIARRFARADPRWAGVLVDLRAHGDSMPGTAPHTVFACAEDLAALEDAIPFPIAGCLGHSFGGKVALALQAILPVSLLSIVDATPSRRPSHQGSETVDEVLGLLRRLRGEVFPDRRAFIARVAKEGIDAGVAAWLAMNVAPAEGGVRFGVDLDVVDALLGDYFDLDLWPAIERAEGVVQLIVGGRSAVYDEDDLTRAARLAAPAGPVQLVTVPEAGHWVHVDAPDAVVDALVAGARDVP